jgi:hypothetical protein
MDGYEWLASFVSYFQQTVNGFAWAFFTAWLLWVMLGPFPKDKTRQGGD